MASTPLSADHALAQAIGLYNAGHTDAAGQLCAGLLSTDPQHPGLRQLMATLCLDRGDAAESLRHIAIGLAVRPDHGPSRSIAARAWYEHGREQHGARELVAAQQSFERSVSLQPSLASAWFALSLVCQDLRRFDAARSALHQVLILAPDNAEAAVNLGLVHQELGDIDAAMASYARAYQQRPQAIGRIANALCSERAGRMWLDLDELKRELMSLSARQPGA